MQPPAAHKLTLICCREKAPSFALAGPQVYRFQSYYVDEKGKGQVSDGSPNCAVVGFTGSSTTTRNSASTRVVEASRSGSRTPAEESVVEPVELYQPPIRRDEIDEMVDAMRPLWQPGMSKNAISQAAFGKAFAGTTWTAKVNAALNAASFFYYCFYSHECRRHKRQ